MSLEYHLEEFKTLHAELASLQGQSVTILQYTLVVIAGLLAWLGTQTIGTTTGIVPASAGSSATAASAASAVFCSRLPVAIVQWLWYVPAICAVVSGFIVAAILKRARHIGDYLHEVETRFRTYGLGWERFCQPSKSFKEFAPAVVLAGWLIGTAGCFWIGYAASSYQKAHASVTCLPSK